MKKVLLAISATCCALILSFSCSQDSSYPGKEYVINGSIQKGPFALGSGITIQPLNDNLNPIGQLYNTFTVNNAGHFNLESEMPTQYAEIIADGYYFDEVTGELSTGTLTLRTITDLENGSVANVNLLTTLIFQRTRNLVNVVGLNVREATIQAERELYLSLGISENNIPNVRCGQLDISQDGDHNALLLTISVALQYNRTTGELSELIAKLSTDLADDGVISKKNVKSLYINEDIYSIIDNVYNNLKNRYNALGIQYTIPEFKKYLSYFIDINGNGVADKLDFIILEQDRVELSPKESSLALPIKYIEDINNIDIHIDYRGESGDEWLVVNNIANEIVVTADSNITKEGKEADIIITDIQSGNSVSIHVYQQAPYLIKFTYNTLSSEEIALVGDTESYYIDKNNGEGFLYCVASPTSITSVVGDITSITIPDTLTDVKPDAFSSCSNLQAFYGKLTSSDNRGIVIRNTLMCFAPNNLTEYTIPNEVSYISDLVFASCSELTKITIPNNIMRIGKAAFAGCSGELIIDKNIIDYSPTWLTDSLFTNLTIGNNVKQIADSAFCECKSITSVTIPSNVQTIGYSAFGNCSGKLNIDNKIVENYNYDNLNSHAWIKNSDFSEVVFGNNVEKIGNLFKNYKSLKRIVISDSITHIGIDAFYGCINLTDVIMGNNVAYIDQCAFSGCSFTNITLPDSVTTLQAGAFIDCTSLESITIPKNVTFINGAVFRGCANLKTVYCKPNTPPKMGPWVFQLDMDNQTNIDCTIYVPTSSVDAYKTAEYWSEYADKIVGYDF